MIENRIGWWKDISDTPSEAFAPEDDVERTRPLSGVVELRKLAAGINYLQLTSFKQKDDDKGIISVEIEKDKLLQLTQRTQKLLGLDEYIQPEETMMCNPDRLLKNMHDPPEPCAFCTFT